MMKSMEYHLFDVVFVIEGTAMNGVYLNEMKTNYIIPALEFFSQGMEDIYSASNKSAGSLFGIVSFKTSQCIPSCNTFGPFISPQKFLKTIDNLDLTGGKSECNASLAEGLATALVCFQDLEKLRDKDTSTNKHCILISNSSPYSMPVSECYEHEGKTVEQLAAIFLEKNINLSIISPRKLPVLFEIFEKSGGDLVLTASKNYSKDPRHLVLLKGFSLKERPASPNMNQSAQPNQIAPTQQAAPNPQPAMMQNSEQPAMANTLGMSNNPGMRQMNPAIRQTVPMMAGANQQQALPQQMGNPPPPPFAVGGPISGNFAQRPVNPQQQQPPQQRWIAPNQTRQPFMQTQGSMPGQGNMSGQGNMTGQGNMQSNNMMSGAMAQNNMMQQNQPIQNQPQQNSALISQLTQPPNINAMTPQQQAMARMAAIQNQQQNQQMMQNQQTNPTMNMVPNTMQNNPQMMGSNQQQNVNVPGVQGTAMAQQNQQVPQQGGQQLNPQQQQQQQGLPGLSHRERIWRGILEWNDKQNQQNTTRQVQCEIYASISKETNEVEVRGDTWPPRLIMQMMPRSVITSVGGQMLRDAKIVNFQWGQPPESFESLSKVMSNGYAGCVHFTPAQCDVKILILLYMADKKSYYGFIPNDQNGYVDKLRRVIQQSKTTQFGQNPVPQNPQQVGARPPMMNMNPITQQNTMNPQGGPQNFGNMQTQGDQSMMFNQQMQMQGPNMVGTQAMNPNQQRMTRPNMMQNNLRHLLQQQQNQFRPQMGGPQQQQPNQQMHGNMDQNYDLF